MFANLFILGAARSGTSFLAHSLAEHPEIALSTPKEPHFMAFAGSTVSFKGPGDSSSINLYSITDPAAYSQAFGQGDERARLDASVTSLYYYEDAIRNLRRFVDGPARFCVVLRDPVDRAFSSYMYQRSRGFEPIETFEEALAAEASRISGGWQHMFRYRAVSDYAAAIAAFRSEFGPEALHISMYEALSAEPQAAVNGVLDHFGLERFDELPIQHRVNSSGEPRMRAMTAARKKLRGHPRVRWLLRNAVPIRYRESIRRANLTAATLSDDRAASIRHDWAELYESLENELGALPDGWR